MVAAKKSSSKKKSKKSVSKERHNSIVFLLVFIIFALLAVVTYTAFNQSYISEDYFFDSYRKSEPDSSQFLHDEEVVIIESESTSTEDVILPIESVLFEYVEVIDGCGVHFEGECLNVRSGPSLEHPVIAQLRNGVVLKVGGSVENEGVTWYKIVFDEWLRYPERVKGDWYVAADYVEVLLDEGSKTVWENDYATSTEKTITVDRSEQKLYAFEGNELFMELDISTGLELTPTPRGIFKIFKKTPSRYMQGPLPYLIDQSYYDLPGVPWNLYFTEGGAVIHGAYWHNSFGSQYSHGCVNVKPDLARELYLWADLGTEVIVKD